VCERGSGTKSIEKKLDTLHPTGLTEPSMIQESMITSTAPNSHRIKTSGEVDAVRSPTDVFKSINSGDWDGALDALRCNPVEASVWVSRRNSNNDGLVWKYLPLHLICLQRHPPLELLQVLLQIYPLAASLPTPHDGNLPIHYVCESGCEDESVFAALLASFPQSLEGKNHKDKTPLLVCHAKSRKVLMNVLRQRKPFLAQRNKAKEKQSKKRAEMRDDAHASSKEELSTVEQRQNHQTVPARHAKYGAPNINTSSETSYRNTSQTPKASNHGRHRKIQFEKDRKHPSVPSATTSSSEDEAPRSSEGSVASRSSLVNFAQSAINYLYPSYEDHGESPKKERQDNPNDTFAQQRLIDELTEKLQQLTASKEIKTDDSKLCERILAKAEADNVTFRTTIQQIRDEKEEIMRVADLKEKALNQRFDQLRTILREHEKGLEMRVDVFANDSSSQSDSDQITEALKAVLSHVGERNKNLQQKVASLEADLSNAEVTLKFVQSKCSLLEDERQSIAARLREFEVKSSILEEDKRMAETNHTELKDRVATLTVINKSLQEQVDSLVNNNASHELERLTTELSKMKEEKAETDRLHAAEIENRTNFLVDKNQSLKDTILSNNEKYSKKVQDLSEKYTALEKANVELRKSLASKEKANMEAVKQNPTKSSSDTPSSVKVQIDTDIQGALMYEV